jgi:hypothetical protein
MKHLSLLLLLLTLLICACNTQKTAYTPQPPQFEIMGKKILREGYVAPRSGTQAFILNREYAGFCFDCKSLLYIISEADSLLLVAHDTQRDALFYVCKNAVGTALDIPLDNTELNEPFQENSNRYTNQNNNDNDEARICGEPAIKSGEFNYTDGFNPDDYPDVEVNLITEKEFGKMQKAAVKHFEANNAVKKSNGVITIGGVAFKDEETELDYPDTFDYAGEYKGLNAYLLLYTCHECEEYTFFLINKTTGAEMGTFSNAPDFSPDFEYVMDIGQLFSDSPTIVRANKWKQPGSQGWYKEFANWSPMGEGFWGSDNCYYTAFVPTITAESYRSEPAREAAKYNYRYLKIRIKAPTPFSEENGAGY